MKERHSIQKAIYILTPLLLYFVVHDAMRILLTAGLGGLAQMGDGFAHLMQTYPGTIGGIVSLLAMLTGGIVVLWLWKKMPKTSVGREQEKAAQSEKAVQSERPGQIAQSGHDRKTRLLDWSLLLLHGICLAAALNYLIAAAGLSEYSAVFGQVKERQYSVWLPVGILLYGIVSPLVEEGLFRGLLYRRMRTTFSRTLCIPISALFFGIYHQNLVQGVYGTLMGLMLAFALELYGTLWAPILYHAAANLFVYLYGTYGGGEVEWPALTGVIWLLLAVILSIIIGKRRDIASTFCKR